VINLPSQSIAHANIHFDFAFRELRNLEPEQNTKTQPPKQLQMSMAVAIVSRLNEEKTKISRISVKVICSIYHSWGRHWNIDC
jgi:hypothetical protein